MTTGISLWAGKRLSGDEEERLREYVALYERAGCAEDAAWLRRFLPEHASEWTPDELEFGAHHGPWLDISAEVEA